ncbi:MAG: DUF2237 domain-containing protein [Gammaproteobacteria bacterium]
MTGPSQQQALNVYGAALEACSQDPLTGFFRDGCCRTCAEDVGQHSICVEMNEDFLLYSRAQGNDLLTPRFELGFPGLLPGDRWCVCLPRWLQAHAAGVIGRVHLRATDASVLASVPLELLERYAVADA